MKVLQLSIFSSLLLAATACVAAPSTAAPAAAPGVSASPVASPSPARAASSLGSGAAAGTTPALPAASVDVSPAEVEAGSFAVSLSVEPARHMVDQSTATTSDPDPAHQASADSTSTGNSTALVLAGLLQLTNNFNQAQQIPSDEPQAMFRHVNVQIHNTSGTETIPYLSAAMDLLLDGHPVVANVPLVPMVDADTAPAQLYYGNNVKLSQRGTYQVFVRVPPSPLMGKDPVPAVQFNLAVH